LDGGENGVVKRYTVEFAINLVDEMIVFACFWDGSGSQSEAVCRINASGGKQKMERRVRA